MKAHRVSMFWVWKSTGGIVFLLFSIGMLAALSSCNEQRTSETEQIPKEAYQAVESMHLASVEPYNSYAESAGMLKTLCDISPEIVIPSFLQDLEEKRALLSNHHEQILDTIIVHFPADHPDYKMLFDYFNKWRDMLDLDAKMLIDAGFCSAPEKLVESLRERLLTLKEMQPEITALIQSRLLTTETE